MQAADLMLTGICAALLSVAHLAGAVTKPASGALRSFAGGAGVAYVFVVILPSLSVWQSSAYEAHSVERLIFAVAMAGLAAYYLLDTAADRLDARKADRTAMRLRVGGFALYSLMAGLVLATYAGRGSGWLIAYTAALGLHFYMNDRLLFSRMAQPNPGRWILAGAVWAGWGTGVLAPWPYPVAVGVSAFLAGGMILIILKEELPAQRYNRPPHFIGGLAIVTAISAFLATPE